MTVRFSVLLFFLLTGFFAESQELRIAFGSCGHQDKPLSILKDVAKTKPDYFIFLGDNIYGDTRDMKVLESKYQQLGKNKNFKTLKKKTKILATWDDHDFGENDAGKYYPKKQESKELFLDFFEEPKKSERRTHEGIYTSYMIEHEKMLVQIILLDCRTFRSDLKQYDSTYSVDTIFKHQLDYLPIVDEDSTLLGSEQWYWLTGELRKKADVRIIGSSTQFGISFNGYEAWANFPYERERMLDVINKTRANGVIFISGDVHYGELSKYFNEKTYPIFDLTSSGLTQSWHFATPNSNRIGGPVMENHYGVLTINPKDQKVQMQIINHNKENKIDVKISLKELKF
jgi:alkaline phosphatase D